MDRAELSRSARPDCPDCHGEGVVCWHDKIPVSCDCTRPDQTRTGMLLASPHLWPDGDYLVVERERVLDRSVCDEPDECSCPGGPPCERPISEGHETERGKVLRGADFAVSTTVYSDDGVQRGYPSLDAILLDRWRAA